MKVINTTPSNMSSAIETHEIDDSSSDDEVEVAPQPEAPAVPPAAPKKKRRRFVRVEEVSSDDDAPGPSGVPVAEKPGAKKEEAAEDGDVMTYVLAGAAALVGLLLLKK